MNLKSKLQNPNAPWADFMANKERSSEQKYSRESNSPLGENTKFFTRLEPTQKFSNVIVQRKANFFANQARCLILVFASSRVNWLYYYNLLLQFRF